MIAEVLNLFFFLFFSFVLFFERKNMHHKNSYIFVYKFYLRNLESKLILDADVTN